MTIDREDQLDGLKHVGRIVAQALDLMRSSAEPGMTTAELDAIGAEFLDREGAKSAPKVTYNFPGATCISVFPAIAHGIPNKTVLKPGHLINIDVSAEKNGYFADTGASFVLLGNDRRLEAQRIALRGDAIHEFGGHNVDAGEPASVEIMKVVQTARCAGASIA